MMINSIITTKEPKSKILKLKGIVIEKQKKFNS